MSWRQVHGALLGAALWLCLGLPAPALEPSEILADPKLEGRARHISADLRCLVCQNQSIDESDAPLARDLRTLVRDRLKAGDSDAAVFRYVVDRYGEFVLLRPTMGPHTLMLWFGPPLILGLGLLALWLRRRPRGSSPVTVPLSRDEEDRLDSVLRSGEMQRPGS